MAKHRRSQHVPDTLGRVPKLDYSATYPILGKQVTFETNCPVTDGFIQDVFQAWKTLDSVLIEKEERFTVRLIMQPAEQKVLDPAQSFEYRLHDGLLLAFGPGTMFSVDRSQGMGTAFVSDGYLDFPSFFRRNILECMALFLATHTNRVPVHASGLIAENRLVLLTGVSSTGKSVLAYGLFKAGWELLTEDAVYISRNPDLRFWGNCSDISLRPDAAAFFPELEDIKPEIQPNGKLKMVIKLCGIDQSRTPHRVFSGPATVIFVKRTGLGQSTIRRLNASETALNWQQSRDTGFDISSEYPEIVERLSKEDTWILENSGELSSSINLIRKSIQQEYLEDVT